MEGYLSNVNAYDHRSTLTRLRISSHQLAIETGRYDKLQRSDRLCTTCDMGVLDDEQHFLAECCSPKLDHLRISLRQSLRLQNVHSNIDAVNVLKLSSIRNLDNSQQKHLQQISKLIHKMYEAKLALLDQLEKNNEH